MLTRVVEHMASLTQCREVARPVVARVMVQMRSGENYPRDPKTGGRADAVKTWLHPREIVRCFQAAKPPTLPVTPTARVLVPPASVSKVQHVAAVGASAMLTASLGANETDEGR